MDRTVPGDLLFINFATELSNNLGLVSTLLNEHPADGPGCPACASSTGRPPVPAPCGVRSVATLALSIRCHAESTRGLPQPTLPDGFVVITFPFLDEDEDEAEVA